MRLAYDDATSISDPSKHYIPNGDMLTESRDIRPGIYPERPIELQPGFCKHSVMAIGGMEVSRTTLDNNALPNPVFGYNDQAGTFSIFNYADYSAGLYRPDMVVRSITDSRHGAISFRDTVLLRGLRQCFL